MQSETSPYTAITSPNKGQIISSCVYPGMKDTPVQHYVVFTSTEKDPENPCPADCTTTCPLPHFSSAISGSVNNFYMFTLNSKSNLSDLYFRRKKKKLYFWYIFHGFHT